MKKSSYDEWSIIDDDDMVKLSGSKIRLPKTEQNKNKNQKNLGLIEISSMDNRVIEIVSQEASIDWYVHETIMYIIHSYKAQNQDLLVVRRRYSDFEWLYQELKFKYPGYLISEPPKKNSFHKIDRPITKVEKFEKQKQNFLNKRRKLLIIFIQKLLNHSELKYCKELQQFLSHKPEEFSLQREISEKFRSEQIDKQGIISSVFSGIKTGFKSAYSYITGGANQQIRDRDTIDEEFDEYLNFYQKYHKNINDLYLVISTITNCNTKQADGLHKLSTNLKNSNQNNESFLKQISIISDLAAIQQENNCQEMIEHVEIKIKALLSHLLSVIEIIKERDTLQDNLFHNTQICKQYKEQQGAEEALIILKKRIDEQKSRLESFKENFRYDKKEFNDSLNIDLKTILTVYSQLQSQHVANMTEQWKTQIDY